MSEEQSNDLQFDEEKEYGQGASPQATGHSDEHQAETNREGYSNKVDEQLKPLHDIVQNLSDTNAELEQRTSRLADLQEVLSDEIENYLSLKEAHDQYVDNIASLLERAGIDPSEVFGSQVDTSQTPPAQNPTPNQNPQRPQQEGPRKEAVENIREEIAGFMEENDVSPQQMLSMLGN